MTNLILLLFVLYFLWLLFLLPVLFTQKVHSPFYFRDDVRNQQIEKNKFKNRQLSAQLYLASRNKSESKDYYERLLKSHDLLHLMVILAEGTDNNSALIQLATQVEQSIKRSSTPGHAMVIFDGRPESKDDIASLTQYYPVVTSGSIVHNNPEENTRINFVGVLNYSIDVKPTYVTILRDTVLPFKDILPNLFYIIENKLPTDVDKGMSTQWLYLHLQEPYHLTHFGFSVYSFQELFVVGFVGFVMYFCLSKYILQVSNYNVNFGIYGAVILVTLSLCTGRPYLTEFRRYFRVLFRLYDFDDPISVGAVSLPLSNVYRMYSYLRTIKCSKYYPFMKVWDSAIGYFGVPAYVVSPSLVRYVAGQ